MRLIDGSTAASEDSDEVFIEPVDRKDYRIVQAEISNAATVSIQGRLSSDLSWVEVHEFTASGAAPVAMFPYMRASMSGNNGTVDVEIDNI